MFWGPWLVFNMCKRGANPEMGMRGGTFSSYGGHEACDLGLMEGLRLRAVVEWASISCTIEAPETSAKGHSEVLMLQVQISTRGGTARGLSWAVIGGCGTG